MKKLLFIPFLLMCFLGVYSRPRAVSLARDNIKVTVYPELCTFEIERKIPGTEKFVPVMSTIDPSTSTTTVRIGDKAYKVSDKKYFSSDCISPDNLMFSTKLFKAYKTLCLILNEVKSEIVFSSAILLKLKPFSRLSIIFLHISKDNYQNICCQHYH